MFHGYDSCFLKLDETEPTQILKAILCNLFQKMNDSIQHTSFITFKISFWIELNFYLKSRLNDGYETKNHCTETMAVKP